MYSHYFYWQYIAAPRWLLRFLWTLQLALLQIFSVRVMLTTLIAHWHRDRVAYNQGTISALVQAAAWNTISRGVGFCVRSMILIAWAVSEIFFVALATGAFAAFLLAPIVALVAVAYGLALVIGGG
jgi:hypothetical protein